MPKFVHPLEKVIYFEQALNLYKQYCKYLDDDFAINGSEVRDYFAELIRRTSPYFWVITEGNVVSGVVYLDNLIGDDAKLHSAELITCFDKRFWGVYTKMCAHVFLRYLFNNLGFEKIKALIYPENFRVKYLLLYSGFKKEALLKRETVKNGKLQDIEVYSVFKERINR